MFIAVRELSKSITNLLSDENRLREERNERAARRRQSDDSIGYAASRPSNSGPSRDHYNEDADLQKALEESRRTAQQEQKKRVELTQE
jgi:epsin